MPEQDYARFLRALHSYVREFPEEQPLDDEDEDDDPGENIAYQSMLQAHQGARAARFLDRLDREYGQKAVLHFIDRFLQYAADAEHAFGAGRPQPRLRLLGCEKDILHELYPLTIQRDHNLSRRRLFGAAGAALIAYSLLGDEKRTPTHLIAGMAGISVTATAIQDECLKGPWERLVHREAMTGFLEAMEETLSRLAADLPDLPRRER